MITVGEVFLLLAGYALGCCCAGYYLVRARAGRDIRRRGSRSAGATNVGRELGGKFFVVTFLLDFSKGALVVWSATYFGLEPVKVVLAILAVVGGHIWPAQLSFRGGKGIATAMGGIVVFDHQIALLVFLFFCVLFVLFGRVSIAGLIAVTVLPAATLALARPPGIVAGLTALSVMILIAHRDNIRDALRATRSGSRPTRYGAPRL